MRGVYEYSILLSGFLLIRDEAGEEGRLRCSAVDLSYRDLRSKLLGVCEST